VNPYDAAHRLARALQESTEFTGYREAQAALKSDPGAREMLMDFRAQQLNLQRQKLSGLELAPEQEEKLEKLYHVITMNLTIKHFLEAEYRLGVLMGDIHKVIGEASAELIDPALLGLFGFNEEDEEEEI
jgi:cell fate (sporulation/competence/biofilm development) regulator YlbF (YheA/YmcA/DUF963 family)